VDELRVLILAEDSLSRAGLASLLAGQPGLAVVGQSPAAAGLPELREVYRPEIVLWDLGWDPAPALPRLAALSDLALPVLLLLPDGSHAAAAWAATQPVRGRGLLLREAGPDRLGTALAAVAQGLDVLDPALEAALLPLPERPPAPPVEPLTPRELEVLRLMAEGLANKSIAQQLGISEHTVKFHANSLMGKLGAQSRTEAVVHASRLGLILL
jgi:DNA-binding NarL/FixJ family response regulator